MVASLARPISTPQASAPPASELYYAHTREDPQLELELVERLARERGRPLRVAVVASGGCTALSLLASPDVARVDAIDLNPAQLYLTELKRSCIDLLSLQEQRRLFGADDATSPDRLKLYDRVRGSLGASAREYWDARPEEIAFGLGHVARFERMCSELAVAFHEEGLDPVDRPSEALGHPAWNGIFGKVFDNGRYASEFGTASTAYSIERPVWQHFSTSFAEALRRSRAKDNYFLAQVFHADDGASPPCLEPDVQDAIRKYGTHRLHLHRGPLLGRLEALSASGKYDLVQTSDVTDWLPPNERRSLMRTVASVLEDDGLLIARRMTADSNLAPAVAAHLSIDAETSARFTARERTFLYQEVVVASRATS